MQGAALRRCYSSLLAQMPGRHAEGSEALNFANCRPPKNRFWACQGSFSGTKCWALAPASPDSADASFASPQDPGVFWSRPWPPASGPSRPVEGQGADTGRSSAQSTLTLAPLLPCAPGCIAAVPLGVASKQDHSSS